MESSTESHAKGAKDPKKARNLRPTWSGVAPDWVRLCSGPRPGEKDQVLHPSFRPWRPLRESPQQRWPCLEGAIQSIALGSFRSHIRGVNWYAELILGLEACWRASR